MQLEKAENQSTHFQISEDCFPFTAKAPGQKYTCKNFDDVGKMLLSPKFGRTPIQHVKDLSVKVGKKWKPIGLESIAFNIQVAHFFSCYSRASAPYVKGYLFRGELVDQPNILYGDGQAFDTIKSAIDECELENVRTLKQQAKE